MSASITFFPVGNGDMALITLESGRTILVDVRIRTGADDPDDETRDVAKDLRKRLKRDGDDRLYVDAFCLSHPDADHCGGFTRHFHLGPPADFVKGDDKILINEIWSSPIVFRRASKEHVLCDDAKAFNTEARRRVKLFRENTGAVGAGDRILILGEDEDGKTDDLSSILVKVDSEFNKLDGSVEQSFRARLLAPLPAADSNEEEVLTKNDSSVTLRFAIAADGDMDACKFLTGGDAEVGIWERQWDRHGKANAEWLEYDLLLTPHHCSWHTLSWDSWSEMGEKAQVSPKARKALSQTRSGAHIVASSEPIKDKDPDPPCVRAKTEYEGIAKDAKGKFLCTGEEPMPKDPEPLEFDITRGGVRQKKSSTGPWIKGGGTIGGAPIPHG